MNEENILIMIAGTISANNTVPVDIELQFRTNFVSLGLSFDDFNEIKIVKVKKKIYLTKSFALPVKVRELCHVQLY